MREYTLLGVAFYIAALLISLTCIVYSLIQKKNDKLQKKIYFFMLLILTFNTVTELVIELIGLHLEHTAAVATILAVFNYLYFITHTLMLPLLGYYVLIITGAARRLSSVKKLLFALPVSLVELLLLTNPIHHFAFYYDESLMYNRSWGVMVLYVVSAFYLLFFTINLFKSWEAINRERRIAMGYFLVMVIGGILIQMIKVDFRVELFAEALAFLGLLLTIEDEGDLLDADTGIYNRRALKIDLDNLIANRRKFHVICIKIENADMIRRVTGSADTGILASIVREELFGFVPRYYIYRTSPDTFVMTLIKETHDQALDLLDRISGRFDLSWKYKRVEVMLNAKVMFACIPDDISDTDAVFNMADSALPRGSKKRLVGKDDLGYLLRRKEIESAIQRAVERHSFEVYYQPTFRAGNLLLYGAEALVRLDDEKLGRIMPDEFIPVAEQIGLIDEVDDDVLRAVCKFIAGGEPKRCGVESINVNLSVVQCTRRGFVERLIRIVDAGGAKHSQVNFEITESIDSSDYEVMYSVVKQLKSAGFRVYMDDYGTGYSNVHSLFAMDFDVVKIDKSILWGAMKSDLGMIILENNVRMLKQMGREILVEGVETGEHVALLKKLGVNYLQGFHFSKPVPEKEFIEFMRDNSSTLHN